MTRLACALGVMLLAAIQASAQSSITGKVLDPQGKPVSNTEVILHAVQEKSGNEVDKDTTKADGTFTVTAKTIDPKAVYFVAVTWNGNLYIGDLMRAPFPSQQEYVVTVGVNPVNVGSGSAATEPSAPTPQETEHDRRAGLIVVLVAGLAIVAIVLLALSRRPPARRRWLVELARLEDELATSADPPPSLQKRRAELRARLRAAQSR